MGDLICPCCLLRGMQMRLDRKGRPYLGCRSCTTMIFVRGGELGAFQAATLLRLLDAPETASVVASQAREIAMRPSALAEMLRHAPPSLTLEPAARERSMGGAAHG